jgi:hypothetical protein
MLVIVNAAVPVFFSPTAATWLLPTKLGENVNEVTPKVAVWA